MALLLAIRHDDLRVVRALLEDATVDVNEVAHLEGVTAAPQELPTYPTTPLVEACRCGDERILRELLSRRELDVNARTTRLRCTALADACARGDAQSVRLLLTHPSIDAAAGDDAVAHPALYAAMSGAVDVLEALAERGVLTDALEDSLMSTAAAAGQARVSAFLEAHFIRVRPLAALSRPHQERKVRMVCAPHEAPGAPGHVPSSALASVCEALGATLSPEEIREAFAVLRVGARVAADGQVLLRVDDIVAMWLLR